MPGDRLSGSRSKDSLTEIEKLKVKLQQLKLMVSFCCDLIGDLRDHYWRNNLSELRKVFSNKFSTVLDEELKQEVISVLDSNTNPEQVENALNALNEKYLRNILEKTELTEQEIFNLPLYQSYIVCEEVSIIGRVDNPDSPVQSIVFNSGDQIGIGEKVDSDDKSYNIKITIFTPDNKHLGKFLYFSRAQLEGKKIKLKEQPI